MPTNQPPRRPQLKVVKESQTGLNQQFEDIRTGEILNRGEVADRIESGQYPGYHILHQGKKRIPRSNPNITDKDNLG